MRYSSSEFTGISSLLKIDLEIIYDCNDNRISWYGHTLQCIKW